MVTMKLNNNLNALPRVPNHRWLNQKANDLVRFQDRSNKANFLVTLWWINFATETKSKRGWFKHIYLVLQARYYLNLCLSSWIQVYLLRIWKPYVRTALRDYCAAVRLLFVLRSHCGGAHCYSTSGWVCGSSGWNVRKIKLKNPIDTSNILTNICIYISNMIKYFTRWRRQWSDN